MPTNQLKKYPDIMDCLYVEEWRNKKSFRAVFDRDIVNNSSLKFKGRPVRPTFKQDGEEAMGTRFYHLTTVTIDEKTKKRGYEQERSIRLHWIKYLLEKKTVNVIVSTVVSENRTYIVDKDEKYVIILEPYRDIDEFFLVTAYHMGTSSYRALMTKITKYGADGIPPSIVPVVVV